MTAAQLITTAIRRKFIGSEVVVTSGTSGYSLHVAAKHFDRLSPGDAQAQVYATLDRLPIEVVARIATIECRST